MKPVPGLKTFFMVGLFLFSQGCHYIDICPDLEGLPENDHMVIIGDSVMAANRAGCSDVAGWMGLSLQEIIPDLSLSGSRITLPRVSPWDITHAYQTAREELPNLDTVILDGGGNDLAFELDTPQIEEDIKSLLSTIMQDGIRKIVFVRYYEFLGLATALNPGIGVIMDGVESFCNENGIVFVDLRPVFHDHPEYYIEGIHPNSLGTEQIALQVLAALEE